MKKLIGLIMLAVMCVSFAGCGSKEETAVFDTSKEIAVILYDNDEYNNSVKDSFVENLKKSYTAQKLIISVKNAKGDDNELDKIVSKISPENTLFAVPIGIEAARAAYKSFGGQLPVFFANIENPVLEGFMADESTPSSTTGILSTVPANYIFNNFVNSIGSSSVGHIGIIFNTSEITPMEGTNEFKRYLDLNNYYYTESVVSNTLEAQQAASKMAYKASSGSSVVGDNTSADSAASKKYENRQNGANMLYLSSDSVVSGSVAEIASALADSDFYVYVNNPESIAGKNFISLKPTSASMGRNLADMAAQYLNGTSISLLPCKTADEFDEFAYLDKNTSSESTEAQSGTQNGTSQNQ